MKGMRQVSDAEFRATYKLTELVLRGEIDGPRLSKADTWRAWIALLQAENAVEQERIRQDVEWVLEDIFR